MSWDVHLEADLGAGEPVRVGDLDANYTYNVSPMFSAVIGTGLDDLDGIRASEMADKCTAILDAFNREPAKFKAMNPTNGWGDFEGARNFIQTILDACRAAPNATLRVC